MKCTVLIEENRGIVEIFEMYFLQLHKIDLVVVVRDHFLQEPNRKNGIVSLLIFFRLI